MKKNFILLTFILCANPAFSQTQIGNDIEGESPGDWSGISVDLSSSGDIIAIGAARGNTNNSGQVRVFENQSGNWVQIGQDIDGEGSNEHSGISVSLSSNGNILAIGANGNNENGSDSGQVRVYENQSGNWIQIGQDIQGEGAVDWCGISVSLSSDGSIVAIGANYNNGNGVDSGHTRVFEYQSGNWVQIGQDIDGEASGDSSGYCVSLSSDGSIVAIGAPRNNGNGSDSGQARIFKNQSGNWIQIGQDIDGAASGDLFGWHLNLSSDGNTVAVGARWNDGNGNNSGHVRVFENQSDNWVQVGQDIEGEATGDEFGLNVSLSSNGSILAIGAFRNNSNGTDSGHVKVYENQSGNWTQLGSNINGEASGDEFGYSVSLSSNGSILASGARYNDGNGSKSGHVRVFQLNPTTSYGTLQVYNLNENNLTEIELELNDLKIAADGSTSTVFKFSGLDDYSDIGFKLKVPISSDPALHGIFDSGTVVNDTLKVTYTHPEYFSEPDSEFTNWKHKDYTIQIYNTQDDTIIEEHPIKIVRPSLLMVHGLWGTSSTFQEMEEHLMQQNTKMYDDFQTNRMSYLASISNNLTVGTLNAQKEVLKSKALQNNISLGKIDVLAHSNGGLLTRTYIQSDFFRNDINKFITFNTPHSGSQLANLVLDPLFPSEMQDAVDTFLGETENGLVENLKVDSNFIQELNSTSLQESNLDYSEIALHTITSNIINVDNPSVSSRGKYIINLVTSFAGLAISPFLFNSSIHDGVVQIESQIAGLPASTTSNPPVPNQFHIGSTDNLMMINEAIHLLNQNPNNTNYFTKQGYNPPELPTFNILPNLQTQSISTESVTINSPAEGSSFLAGSTVNVDVIGTSGITDILTALGNQDIPLQVHETENNSSDNFQLTIPNEAIGRVEIVSSGFDANGFADNASTHIMVTTSAVLDSIQIEQDLIYTAEGQLGQFDVSGYYDDNVKRNITNLDNLQYAFTTGNAEFTENGLITGLTSGVDTLTVSYLGESSSVPITIASQDEWVQLELNTRIKTFLQGPYDVNSSLMNDDLRSQNLIPLTSPYPDGRPAENGVFDAGGITGNGLPEDDIVDWVWVELRNENDSTIVEEAKSALLQRDGDIVEPDGFSRLSFYSPEANYYIVVKHRNHLSIMSQNPVQLSWYTTDIDFTNGNMTTFGTNAQNILSDGNLALWAGDVSNDGTIQYAGSTPESTSLLSFVLNDPDNFLNLPTHAADGYNNEDVNMDGITQYAGSDAEMPLILQNVLSSPLNFLNLISFPIEEQLPENVND